jgi:uncharacterized OB-fold protein
MGDDISPIVEEIQRRMDRYLQQDTEERSIYPNCPSCGARYEFGKKRCSYCASPRLLRRRKDKEEKTSYIPPVSCF